MFCAIVNEVEVVCSTVMTVKLSEAHSMAHCSDKEKAGRENAAGSTTNPAPTYSPDNPAVTVPSALVGLTAVFGMGTGVTPPPSAPETLYTFQRASVGQKCPGALLSENCIAMNETSVAVATPAHQ